MKLSLNTAYTLFYTLIGKAFPGIILYLLLSGYDLDKDLISFLLPASIILVPILNLGLDFQLTVNASRNRVHLNKSIMLILGLSTILFASVIFLDINNAFQFCLLLAIALQHSQFYASHFIGLSDYRTLTFFTIPWRIILIGLLVCRVPIAVVNQAILLMILVSIVINWKSGLSNIIFVFRMLKDILTKNVNFLLNAILAAGIFLLPRILSTMQSQNNYAENILISGYGLSILAWITYIRRYTAQLLKIDFRNPLSMQKNLVVSKTLRLMPFMYLLSLAVVLIYCLIFGVNIKNVKLELNLLGVLMLTYGLYALFNDRLAVEFRGGLQLVGNVLGFTATLVLALMREFKFLEITDFSIYFVSILCSILVVVSGFLFVKNLWKWSSILVPVLPVLCIHIGFSVFIYFL